MNSHIYWMDTERETRKENEEKGKEYSTVKVVGIWDVYIYIFAMSD